MTLYFDTKAQFLDGEAVSTVCCWHLCQPLFAVSSYNQNRGACVTIFDDSGEPLRDVTYPVHTISQATALAWHPEKRQLVAGWENGEINAWMAGERKFASIGGSHKSPIIYVGFSEQGGRMVSADSTGIIIGWRCDSHGGQFTQMFSHDLRDATIHVTFRKTVTSLMTDELNNLAKLAVAGDEIALDALTNWRPKTAARGLTHAGVKDNQCFYVICQSGAVFYVNQSGASSEVLRSDSAMITQLLWHPKREVIVTLMEDMMVGHYIVEPSGALTEMERVKLSGKVPGKNGIICWASNALAVITGDFNVRIFDIDTSESFLLPMGLTKGSASSNTVVPKPEMKKQASTSNNSYDGIEDEDTFNGEQTNATAAAPSKIMEVFTCIAYCNENHQLCAGTNQGNVYIWKKRSPYSTSYDENENNAKSQELEHLWQLSSIANVRGAIKHCSWGVCDDLSPCVLVNCISNVFILKEQPLLSACSPSVWVTQKSANQLYIEHASNHSTSLRSEVSVINGICLNDRYLAITDSKSVIVYQIPRFDDFKHKKPDNLSIKQIHNFPISDLSQLFIHEETLIVIGALNARLYSFGGVVLKEINATEVEGKLIGASLTQQYLTIFTINGYLKLYDLSRHEPKLVTPSKSCYDLFENFGEIIMAKCNSNGTFIALTIASESLVPDGKLYFWDLSRDRLSQFDFLSNKTQNKSKSEMAAPAISTKEQISRLPTNFYWDSSDLRILACETICLPKSGDKKTPTSMSTMATMNKRHFDSNHSVSSIDEMMGSQIVILFPSNDKKNTIKAMEFWNLAFNEQLAAFHSPLLITLKNGQIDRHTLSNFKGIENIGDSNRKLILDFSIFMADDKMDEAFRCIRSIQSDTIWENLAKKCVQTGRLDVAKICLGNLKRALSVRALRLAMADETLPTEAKIAVLAIELQMIPEAEALYKKCGRYDLLNELLQACGRFEEALQIAERLDRVHLKNTYYEHAEWLKQNNDIKNAIVYFGKSNNTAYNTTQLLINEPDLLKKHMEETKDVSMLKWWAQYTESTGDMDGALRIYQKAEDWFSQVRILCFLGDLIRADQIARQSGDKSACYHLARHYENIGKNQEAIQFYTQAQTYGNAVRICREHNLPNELWSIANLARPRDKALAAAFFEETEDYKRAVELYHRSGMLHKAVEMAFASQQPETLQVIAADLDENSDAELVQRCAEFFVESQQPQKAAQLLAKAKFYEKSLTLCRMYKLQVSDNLADLLTPDKDEIDENLRIKILNELGEILQEQGDYHTATKKFIQSGEKIRAMKSLLKSGDTDKIVFFAGMSRQKEVYIMAANYLQSLNWQSDAKVLKNIIQFYSKAHAYDLLANFYAVCAQVEIDEFHDYEKALKALQEATRCVNKISGEGTTQLQRRVSENLGTALQEVQKVIEIAAALERGDFNNVIAVCKSMLSISERPPVRAIHIQAILIESLIRNRQYEEALGVLRQLSEKSNDWSYKGLLERPLIEKLAHECGVEFNTIWNMGRQAAYNDDDKSENDDEIQEEIE